MSGFRALSKFHNPKLKERRERGRLWREQTRPRLQVNLYTLFPLFLDLLICPISGLTQAYFDANSGDFPQLKISAIFSKTIGNLAKCEQNLDLTQQFVSLTQQKSSSNSKFRQVFASKCRKDNTG